MLKRYTITVVLAVYSFLLFPQLQVKNYFSLTGKKDVPVNVIMQDNGGFLWLGTNDGVFKFDGRSAVSVGNEYPVLKQDISAIFIDAKQTTWIGTKSGKIYFLINNRLDSLKPAKPNEDKITSFCELNSTLWIGTYGNGVYALHKNDLKHFDAASGLSDNVIYKITSDGMNTLWCGTDAGITEIITGAAQPVFKIISDKNGLADNIVRDISFEETRLLVAMQDSGLCYYNIAKKRIEKNTFSSGWSLGAIVNASDMAGNKLIIATEKNGLLLFDKGGMFTYNYETYLQSGSINQLLVDREKQVWVASKKGISRFSEKRFSFINASKGITDDDILAVAIDNDNGIWIGTSLGISKIESDNEGKLVIDKMQGLQKATISCATKAPDGNIWFGTYGTGIVVLSAETKNSVNLAMKDNQVMKDNISNIYFANKNTVYVSTLGSGLIKAKVDPDNKNKSFEIEKIYTEDEGLGSNYVYAALTDNNGKLYVATDGGGLQLLENDKFVDLTKRFKLTSNTVFSLCRDQFNTIWATSNADGVLKYDGKTLQTINLQNGLRDAQPQQIIASDNTVYALTSKGIDKIDCKDNSVTYYDLFDGDLEPNLNAVFFKGDKIYSGTNNGLLVYRTSHEKCDSIKPMVFIKSMKLNYKPFKMDSIFEFKYNQNNFDFAFDAIWLKNPDKLFYRYKLHDFEKDWLYADEGKTVTYNNLDPGNYTFIVQVKNEEEIWSDPTGYSFIVKAPIWHHWWFWVLVVGGLTLGVYFLVRYRLRALQKENLLLERRVKERTHQIERQSQIIETKNKELEQLSLVASKTDNVVLILDANGKLEYVNESFVKLNKMNLEEITQKYGDTIYDLSNNENIRAIINDAVTNKRSVNYESLNKISPDSEVWESSTLTPLFDDSGHLKKIIIIDTDVTERKKQEQIIFQKNKDITDSISYARKIQHAILPNNALIKNYLPNSFVLYMTKDIVSGDFYWFSHIDGCSIIAAVDCTGHGVPGAFMSLIGYNVLNKIVNEQKITDPKDILLQLNNGILDALHKNESESKDGMDIAICKICHDKNTLEYAGAMRPLWIVSNGFLSQVKAKESAGTTNELTEVKADKIPIGTKQKDREETIAYTTHVIPLKKGDTFYIFTDGYADQFGGPKDKKYSTGKFKDLLIQNSNLDFNTQEQNIRNAHLHWKGDNEQVDDILVIGFGF
ncbi:MAG: triple tyrosine motif-containing protein [Bacteroidota bacterium]